MNGTYHEYRSYSPLHDAEMVRLSVFDARGAEYFMMLAAGRKYRDRRLQALDDIDYAIQRGMQPGEVRVTTAE